jgi:hypothetical protein
MFEKDERNTVDMFENDGAVSPRSKSNTKKVKQSAFNQEESSPREGQDCSGALTTQQVDFWPTCLLLLSCWTLKRHASYLLTIGGWGHASVMFRQHWTMWDWPNGPSRR